MTKRPYAKQRRAALEAEMRERIVRAAVELHAEHGGLATSYAMIAKRAQVSPQTVYNHFPGPDALFGACTGHAEARAPELGPRTFQSGSIAARRLALLARAVCARHEFMAPWMRKGWYEAALVPERGAIVEQGNDAPRKLVGAALAPDREPLAGFAEAAFVLLDYPAWKEFTRRRSSAGAARIAGDCLADLVPRPTRPSHGKGKP